MTGNPLESFRKFFGAARAIFWPCAFFLPSEEGLIWIETFRSRVSPLSMRRCQRLTEAWIPAAESTPEKKNTHTPWRALRILGMAPISAQKRSHNEKWEVPEGRSRVNREAQTVN